MGELNALTMNSHEFHTNWCTERHTLPKGVNEILFHCLRSSTDKKKKIGTGEVLKNLLSDFDVAKIGAVKVILYKGRGRRPICTVHVCVCCVCVCVCVCMYVFMCVCMYACMCTYVCIYVFIYACMYVMYYVYMYVRMYVCMYSCMYVCYVCMPVRMYVCV